MIIRMHLYFGTLIAVMLSSPWCAAEDSGKISGSTFLSQESCAGNVKAPDCVLSFQIQGKAAEQLYKGMRVKAHHDECTESDAKDDGNGLRCYDEGKGKFSCDFGYSFKDKRFGPSEVVC